MGSIGELPSGKSADLQLVIATPEEAHAQQVANSTEWRGALELEPYLRREGILGQQELARDGGLTTWVLVHPSNGGDEREVLCGCETFKKKALVARNGTVEDAVCHGVCSVFCPPEKRGKGYAGRMMSELGPRLKDWQAEECNGSAFSVLFSDIGKKFYAARGWHPFPSSHVALPAKASTLEGLPTVRVLESADLAEMCQLDERVIRTRLSKPSSAGKTSVALIPDYRTLSWHHAREDFIAAELYKRTISARGAVAGEPGKRVWCFWTRVWPNPAEQHAVNTLHILRLGIEDPEFSDFAAATPSKLAEAGETDVAKSIAAVFAAAQAEASNWDMAEVQLWNPTSTALAAAQRLDVKAAVEHREDESITSLQWYGEGSWEDVDWNCNEKYCWC